MPFSQVWTSLVLQLQPLAPLSLWRYWLTGLTHFPKYMLAGWTLKQLGNIPLSSWCGTTTNALEQLWYQCDTQIGTWVAYINIADAHPQCFWGLTPCITTLLASVETTLLMRTVFCQCCGLFCTALYMQIHGRDLHVHCSSWYLK